MSDWSKKRRTLIIIPKGVTTKAKIFQTKKNSSKKVRYGNKGNQRCLLALLSKEIDSEFSNFREQKNGRPILNKTSKLAEKMSKFA